MISIAEYTDAGFKGELLLQFHNDRLMSTWFFPSDLAGYKAAMPKTIVFNVKQEATISPRTKIWIAKAINRGFYIGWEDTALAEEEMDWIAKHS